jgi:hypothetical protein
MGDTGIASQSAPHQDEAADLISRAVMH